MGENIDKLLQYVKDNNVTHLHFSTKENDELQAILFKEGPEAYIKALQEKRPRSEEEMEKLTGEIYQLLTSEGVDVTNQRF
jgi:hypothetical protein